MELLDRDFIPAPLDRTIQRNDILDPEGRTLYMRLKIGNETFIIGFRYGNEQRNVPGHGTLNQEYTIATIRTGEKGENIFASAKVYRYHKDRACKEAARKAALKAALGIAAGLDMETRTAFRTAIWNAYHSRPGGINAMQRSKRSFSTHARSFFRTLHCVDRS